MFKIVIKCVPKLEITSLNCYHITRIYIFVAIIGAPKHTIVTLRIVGIHL